jgi:leucyl/phenylalanyl-tRNA--protein transferase
MQLHILDDTLWFPPVTEALDDGLLAVGGDLSVERLLLAYNSGIFPWYAEDEPPMWWSPDPRFVLFPDELKVSKSMKQVLKRNTFQFKMNTAFEQVINNCRMVFREGQGGTWIGDDVVAAYTQLHKLGYAHSAEAWQDGELVGGLYGIWLGNAFFGESMFTHRSNASKFAFINMVELLQSRGVQLIDCQVYTEHLESLGAVMVDRNTFIKLINELNPVL